MRSSIRRWFNHQSITRKVTIAVLVTSGIALAWASALFVAYDYRTAQAGLVEEVMMLAGVIGSNSTAALEFADEPAANEMAAGATETRNIRTLRLFTRGGRTLGVY